MVRFKCKKKDNYVQQPGSPALPVAPRKFEGCVTEETDPDYWMMRLVASIFKLKQIKGVTFKHVTRFVIV